MSRQENANKKSLIIVFIISAAILFSHFNLPRYKTGGFSYELSYDVASYYLYLPMSLIYHDPGMKTPAVDSLFTKYKFSPTLYQVHNTENNTRVPNYTSGMSYFYLPFFYIGHFWAMQSGNPADGFSLPYQKAISWGVYIIILPGIFLLRRLLLKWFSDNVVSIALIILFFGTNYFSEAIGNHLQPHTLLFTLYVVLIYYTHKWHEKNKLLYAAIIGFTAGWITLARPTDIICFLIPLLWNIKDKESLNFKIQLLKAKFSHLLILVFFAALPFIPQFIYWKITTGNFIYYSYKNTEGFDFLSPHILSVLFSFKKSLLIYTPLILLPFAGLFFMSKRLSGQKNYILLFTILNFYLLSSWAVWWCGASFGMRYFVQSFSVLSIPLCITIERISELSLRKILIYPLIGFFIFLNLFQTWQFVHWILPEDRMTFKYYKASFLKTSVTEEDHKLMEVERNTGYTESFNNESEYVHHTLAFYNFESLNSTTIDSTLLSNKYFVSAPYSCRLTKQNEYYPTFKIRYDNLVKANLDHVWLRVTCDYYSETDLRNNPASLVMNLKHKNFSHKYRAFDLEKNNFESGKWNTITVDYMTPYPYSQKDIFELYMWYRGNSEIYIDNLKVEVFEKKQY